MAVRGIGIDIVKVERIQESLERFGHRMEARLFTTGELDYCRQHRDPCPIWRPASPPRRRLPRRSAAA